MSPADPIPTALPEMDTPLGDMQPGDLDVIAQRVVPAPMSALAASFASGI